MLSLTLEIYYVSEPDTRDYYVSEPDTRDYYVSEPDTRDYYVEPYTRDLLCEWAWH